MNSHGEYSSLGNTLFKKRDTFDQKNESHVMGSWYTYNTTYHICVARVTSYYSNNLSRTLKEKYNSYF